VLWWRDGAGGRAIRGVGMWRWRWSGRWSGNVEGDTNPEESSGLHRVESVCMQLIKLTDPRGH
jgi:hypothetical protein